MCVDSDTSFQDVSAHITNAFSIWYARLVASWETITYLLCKYFGRLLLVVDRESGGSNRK